MSRRVTVTISDAGYAEAERQAAESGKTVAQWAGWLVDTYMPPDEPSCSGCEGVGLTFGGYICSVCRGSGKPDAKRTT